MTMYLGMGRKCATSSMTATHARTDHVGHKCTWTIHFHLQHYLTIHIQRQHTAVGLLDQIEKRC